MPSGHPNARDECYAYREDSKVRAMKKHCHKIFGTSKPCVRIYGKVHAMEGRYIKEHTEAFLIFPGPTQAMPLGQGHKEGECLKGSKKLIVKSLWRPYPFFFVVCHLAETLFSYTSPCLPCVLQSCHVLFVRNLLLNLKVPILSCCCC